MYERFQAEVDSCKYERRRGVHWLGRGTKTGQVSAKKWCCKAAPERQAVALLPA